MSLNVDSDEKKTLSVSYLNRCPFHEKLEIDFDIYVNYSFTVQVKNKQNKQLLGLLQLP